MWDGSLGLFSPSHPLSLLQECCRSFSEELSLLLRSCCSTAGMVQARLNTKAEPTAQTAGEENVAPVGKSGLCLFLEMNLGRWWEVGWKLEESFLSIWIRTASSQLPLQLWFNKNRFVMLMLHKAPVLHSSAGHEISFISIFYGKGEHSELMCRLWCPWWK